jgi:hypothetical protein
MGEKKSIMGRGRAGLNADADGNFYCQSFPSFLVGHLMKEKITPLLLFEIFVSFSLLHFPYLLL